jgi:alcohol dehydrogenase
MQALHYIGDRALEWREIPDATLIEPTDAIVRPLAVAACDLDRTIVDGQGPFPAPFVLGHEFVGVVTACGDAVDAIDVGTVVLASFQPSCGSCTACRAGLTAACVRVPPTSMYGIGSVAGEWSGAFADAVRVPWADFNLRRLPDNVEPAAAASASDNFADALRGVDAELAARPGASVLIAGNGSIPLYAIAAARHLGAGRVTYASADLRALSIAERLGADCLHVNDWPRRFDTHDITMDCTNRADGLAAVIRSTAPFGLCTGASIFFGESPALPLRDMYMRGIRFHTGRVHSAASLDRALELIASGLDPRSIEPVIYGWDDIARGFRDAPPHAKLVFVRPAAP